MKPGKLDYGTSRHCFLSQMRMSDAPMLIQAASIPPSSSRIQRPNEECSQATSRVAKGKADRLPSFPEVTC
eukprot:4788596-Amphidinium_carterae.1